MTPRFLIADRDPTIREECRRFLSTRGFDVDVAADGLQCIEQLRSESPTVLVLDPEICWGGGDGVLEWLRDEAPLANVTVVLANGHGCQCIPARLYDMVATRLDRPCGLRDMESFVSCLENEMWHRRPTPQQLIQNAANKGS